MSVKVVHLSEVGDLTDDQLLISPEVYFFHALSGNSDFVIEFRRSLFAHLRRHRKLQGGMVREVTPELFKSIGVRIEFDREKQYYDLMVGDNSIATYSAGIVDRMFLETVREGSDAIHTRTTSKS